MAYAAKVSDVSPTDRDMVVHHHLLLSQYLAWLLEREQLEGARYLHSHPTRRSLLPVCAPFLDVS